MLEPDLYIFDPEDGGSLKSQGPAKLEWQTPKEFLASAPLESITKVQWGQTHVRFVRLTDVEEDETPPCYALVERFEDDGRPNPQWALIMVEAPHLDQFKTMFKEYCEQ